MKALVYLMFATFFFGCALIDLDIARRCEEPIGWVLFAALMFACGVVSVRDAVVAAVFSDPDDDDDEDEEEDDGGKQLEHERYNQRSNSL